MSQIKQNWPINILRRKKNWTDLWAVMPKIAIKMQLSFLSLRTKINKAKNLIKGEKRRMKLFVPKWISLINLLIYEDWRAAQAPRRTIIFIHLTSISLQIFLPFPSYSINFLLAHFFLCQHKKHDLQISDLSFFFLYIFSLWHSKKSLWMQCHLMGEEA